jgi:hypothetical protein
VAAIDAGMEEMSDRFHESGQQVYLPVVDT